MLIMVFVVYEFFWMCVKYSVICLELNNLLFNSFLVESVVYSIFSKFK